MAATEGEIKQQLGSPASPTRKTPVFFKSTSTQGNVSEVLDSKSPRLQEKLIRLLRCAGFGGRLEAETIFKETPALLLMRGDLTDMPRKSYKHITAFEYVVRAKDVYFFRRVLNFLESYEGKDKSKIIVDLLAQFNQSFSKDCLASISGLSAAYDSWRARSKHERVFYFVSDIGEAQVHLEAHILQAFCHPTLSFHNLEEFIQDDLPEHFTFHNWDRGQEESLLDTSPGYKGNFVLARTSRGPAAQGEYHCFIGDYIASDLSSLSQMDQALTAELLTLKARLEVMAKNALELDASTPDDSSSPSP